MNIFKTLYFFSFAIFFAACGNNTTTPLQADIQSISIDQRAPVIYSTDLQTALSATVTLQDNSTKDVTDQVNWFNSDYTVASMQGGAIWGALDNGGDTNISIQYGKFSDYVTLHVVKLTDFNISIENSDANTTGTYNLVLKGTFEDNATRQIYNNVTYSTTNGAIITTDDNNITTVQITTTGETNVTATLFYDDNLTKTISYTAN